MEVVARATPAIRARRGVAAIPLIPQNPYQRLLYQQLAGLGVPLEAEAQLRVGWLLRSRNRIAAIHIHWPQGLYRHHGRAAAALSWVRLALLAVRLGAARLLGYRILWTVHQLYPHEQRHGALDRAASRLLASAAHSLLVHDAVTAARVCELRGTARKVSRVPHGSYVGVYPPGRCRGKVRAELGLQSSTVVFLAFGHVRGYKDLDILLDGFAEARIDDAALVVAGLPLDGPAAALVAERAAEDPRIVPLLEFVPDERVAELFGAVDAAVVSRGDGGTSGALILALSLGTPVVVADSPSYSELIGHGRAGWLFAGGDPSALARALEVAAADPDGIDARVCGARKAAGTLSWAEAARVTSALILPDAGR
jgi:glycosyltransferase involved in cell wall biosynthesis